ncbi:hypothetical protein J4E83_003430 [Alternaria metachromatica]|uniref:uncharacterized protein n=1 Tax=Alternaria metachromatica TaxID=283354 RepID=UPI0020C325A8|nr:uncharacterized protein J4E83_003430 [Alternaria metachromatica]KAI4628877.1 hypothetical protein J4E83_003430 [Alternaria metachromatica]
MASSAFDNDDDGSHLGRQQQPTPLPNSAVASENNGSDSDDERDLFRLSLELTIADRNNSDLKREIQRLQSEVDASKTRERDLERTNELHIITVSEAKSLRARVQVLGSTIEQKDTELIIARRAATTAEQDAAKTRTQLQANVRRLQSRVDSLERELSNANTRSNEMAINQAAFDDLQTRVDQLSAQNRQYVLEANINTTDVQRLMSKIDGQKRELEDLQEKLVDAETASDRLRAAEVQMQTDRNIQAAGHPPSSDGRVDEDPEAENEVDIIKDKLAELRWNALDYVMDLDLANRNFRAFDCEHDNVRNVPDGRNSSYGPTAVRVAQDIFRDWQDDEQFMRGYTHRRQKLIKHHKAHGRIQEGNGVRFWLLRDEFNNLDGQRGVNVTYN